MRRGQLGVYDDRITSSATNLPDFSQQPAHCDHCQQEDDRGDAMRFDFQEVCDIFVGVVVVSIQLLGTECGIFISE